jgi:hypothetical protein
MTLPHFTDAYRLYAQASDDWVPCTMAAYDDAIGAVPPIDMTAGGFILGEAYSHNAAGRAVYAVFRKTWKHGKRIGAELRMMTAQQGRKVLGI